MPATPDPFDAWRNRRPDGSADPSSPRPRGGDPKDLASFMAEFEKDFPGFFADFEREFARMSSMLEKVMEDAIKHAQGPQRGEPFVYGFSMRVGNDGMPKIQPFGSAVNQNPVVDAPEGLPESREPMHDVIETDAEVTVTVEMPGVEKGDVKLQVAQDAVTVKVEKGRRYAARIRLPAKVDASSAKATFKNGILDLTLRKQPDQDAGHHVSIE